MGIEVQFPAGANILLFFTVSILAVWPMHPPTLLVPQAVHPTVKQLQSDPDQSDGPIPKVKSARSLPNAFIPKGLIRHRDNSYCFHLQLIWYQL